MIKQYRIICSSRYGRIDQMYSVTTLEEVYELFKLNQRIYLIDIIDWEKECAIIYQTLGNIEMHINEGHTIDSLMTVYARPINPIPVSSLIEKKGEAAQ